MNRQGTLLAAKLNRFLLLSSLPSSTDRFAFESKGTFNPLLKEAKAKKGQLVGVLLFFLVTLAFRLPPAVHTHL